MRHVVTTAEALGTCLARLFPESSGRTRKQMLVDGRVRVNGRVTKIGATTLAGGDTVEIGARGARVAAPRRMALVHEDDDVLVADKPAGLLTIATERERIRTLYYRLTEHARLRTPPGRVFVVHRLDRRSSGLLVFATTPGAKRTLQAQFAAHTAERVYLAVVEGRVEQPEGTIRNRLLDDAPGRVWPTTDPARGRIAATHWRVRRRGPAHTLLEVRLETGRRNQIRAHLAGLGHPIAGDREYGARSDPLGRLGLHAHVLGFDHPRSGARLRFVSPAPGAFAKLRP